MTIHYARWAESETIPLHVAMTLLVGGDPASITDPERHTPLVASLLGIIQHAKEDTFFPVYDPDGHPVVGDGGFLRGAVRAVANWHEVRQVVREDGPYVHLGSFLEWSATREDFLTLAWHHVLTYPHELIQVLREQGHEFSATFLEAHTYLLHRKETYDPGGNQQSDVGHCATCRAVMQRFEKTMPPAESPADPWGFLPKNEPYREKARTICHAASVFVRRGGAYLYHGTTLSANKIAQEMIDQSSKWWDGDRYGPLYAHEKIAEYVSAWLHAGQPLPPPS
ncbi:MAG: hypothetical protein HQL77_14880 [Magnetococcales bacterium]|nr:hypothetical protein [Magnetococcales bacterium]